MLGPLLPIATISNGQIEPDDYIVFGGTFDPIHEGHLSIIRSALELFGSVIVAATTENPWKSDKPAPVALRKEMINLVLQAEQLPLAAAFGAPGISIYPFDYQYSEEVVHELRAHTDRGKLYWAVGEDTAADVHRWRNWDQLNVPVIVCPVIIELHATEIRSGTSEIHPALVEFVRSHKLYV